MGAPSTVGLALLGVLASGPLTCLEAGEDEAIERLIVGERRSFDPRNDLHRQFWTYEYPSAALLPMAALVDLANAADPRSITIPSLFVYSPLDQVIRPELVKAKAGNWGGPATTIEVTDDGDQSHHVIAGAALSPSTTERLAAETARWIAGL